MHKKRKLKESIAYYTLNNFLLDLKRNPEEVFSFMEQLANRELTISETVIGVDRKLLFTWYKQGLMPFKRNEKWSRFSFIECCWLRFIIELRSVGIGLEKIKKIKESLFPQSFFTEVEFDNTLFKQITGNFPDKNDKITEEIEEVLVNELQLTYFSAIIYSIIMFRDNFCVLIDSSEEIEIIDVNDFLEDIFKAVPEWIDIFNNKSLAIVNLKKIVADLSGTHEYFSKKLDVDFKMSENAVEKIKSMFLSNNINEVTIRVTENGKPTLFVKKDMEIKELQRYVHSLSKKGTFRDIIVKTRDGNIQYFETTDIIKL